MATHDSAFTGSIPQIYDSCLGPLLFQPYADDLAERAAKLAPARVLETAAGTGIVTAALVDALPNAEIVVTDLNQAMLDVAAARVAGDRMTFRAADAQTLPFDDGVFDLVVCQFGVMFFPDRVRAYGEARRVLAPGGALGGAFLFNAWHGFGGNPIPAIVEQAVAALFPGDPPGFLGRTPYGYDDQDRIAGDLRAAGFDSIAIDPVTFPSRASSARQAAIGFAHGSPLRAEIEARDPARLEEAADVATRALEREFGTGPIEAPMQANVVLAKAA